MGEEKNNGIKSFFFDWMIPIIAAIVLTLLINKFLIFKVSVPTGSMSPTIKPGDQIFVTKIYNPKLIKRGDIVVFYSHELNDRLIKRVIGLPGEKVEIKDDGKVYIDGKLLDEPYVKFPSDKKASFVVPEGEYLMLGDNRADSQDARYWNNPYIDGKDISAKAGLRVYPFNRFGFVN